jgi:hypothetical protein
LVEDSVGSCTPRLARLTVATWMERQFEPIETQYLTTFAIQRFGDIVHL